MTITDAPRFVWRGLMVDSSRHFLPVATLLTLLEGMSSTGLNVLHWHITDEQAFPLQTTSCPRLAQLGAYSFPGLTYVCHGFLYRLVCIVACIYNVH